MSVLRADQITEIFTKPGHEVHQVVLCEEIFNVRIEGGESEHESEREPADEEGEDDDANHQGDSSLPRLLLLHLSPGCHRHLQVTSILLHPRPPPPFV